MKRLILRPRANADIEEICRYIEKDNSRAAQTVLKAILRKARSLPENPLIGRSRDELRVGLRSLPVGSYLIFYYVGEEEIVVARVLHGARDLPSLFG